MESLIQESNGFRWGEPVRPDDAVAIVVPILRSGVAGEPSYLLLEEVKDRVEFADSGRIGGVRVRARGVDKPIFIRSGTILKGRGTQSRAPAVSAVVYPEVEAELEVRCVHASHPVVGGRRFEAAVYKAPTTVQRALLTGSQYAVWSSVRDYAMSRVLGHFASSLSRSLAASAAYSRPADSEPLYVDDLPSLLEVEAGKKFIDEIVKQLPVLEDQVGIAVLDMDGAVGMELFDHPKSWKALAESIVKSYEDALSRRSGLFKPDASKVREELSKFLAKIQACEAEPAYQNRGATTFLLKSQEIVGEYTVLGGEVIHLLAMRRGRGRPAVPAPAVRTREPRPAEPPRRPWAWETVARPAPYAWIRPARAADRLKKRERFVRELAEPHTFTELKRLTGVSDRTLSTWLKNMQSSGYVGKVVRDNGKAAYALTARGRYWLRLEDWEE